MPTTNRTAILRGPGAAKFGSVVLHDADGINASIAVDSNPVTSSIEGEFDTLTTNRYGEVSLRPAGNLSADILSALFPHQTPVPGTPLFGAADVPLIVHSKAGQKLTFLSSALVQPPQLRLSATATAFGGPAKWRCLLAAGTAPGDDASFLDITAEAYSAVAYPFSATAKGGLYVGTLGETEIRMHSGWTIDVTLQLQPFPTDLEGELALDLVGVTVIAKGTPVATALADLAARLPWNSVQGSSARSGENLVISAGPGSGVVKATLYDVSVMNAPFQWGPTKLLAGEYAFLAHRAVSGDALGALYQIIMEPEA